MNTYGENERQQDFDFFISHYDEFFQKYGHKFIVIRLKEVIGIYDTEVDAVNETSKKYPIGTFIVQECNGDESGYTNYISSWQLVSIK